MFIDHKKKVIFFHIPKTAGSSVGVLLKDVNGLRGSDRLDPLPPIHHMSMLSYDTSVESESTRGYDRVTFVRNPWDRLLSAFTEFSNPVSRPKDTQGAVACLIQDEYKNKGFIGFCEDLPKIKDVVLSDIHFKPQMSFIYNDKPNYGLSYLGRYETLSSDWCAIASKYGYPPKLGWHRNSGHPHYKDMYSETTKNIVGEIFEEDITSLGYEF
mgnify:CR=1 FL=1|tara:strand:- start:2240 stop:2875 length:636 start_codon:yes stop_codon:yes gene_type:complete